MGCTQAKPNNNKKPIINVNKDRTNTQQSNEQSMNTPSKYNQKDKKILSQNQLQSQRKSLKVPENTNNLVKQNLNKQEQQKLSVKQISGNIQNESSKQKSIQKSVKQVSLNENSKILGIKEANQNSQTDSIHMNSIQNESLPKNSKVQSSLGKKQLNSNYLKQNQRIVKISQQNDISKNQLSLGNLDDAYLGMESKVQRNTPRIKNQINEQRLNFTTYHAPKNGKDKQNNNQKLFHSHHQQKVKKTFQQQLPQSQKAIKQAQNKIQKHSHIEDLQSMKELDKSKNLRSIKSNVVKNDEIYHSKQRNDESYHSVLQQRKGFQERFNNLALSQQREQPKVQNSRKNNQTLSNQKSRSPMNDYLIEEYDQQGPVKIPIQTSYKANSKHQIDYPSKKSIHSESRVTDKYLKESEKYRISQKPQKELQMDQSSMRESSKKLQNSSSHKKQSRLETGYFKYEGQKYNNTNEKQNQNSKQSMMRQQNKANSSQQKKMNTSTKKKAGPIQFSQISFDKDSQLVPEQERFTNDLQMSVHLNFADNY